jgi:hypothetical protein
VNHVTDQRKDSKGRVYPVRHGPPEGGWPTIPKPPEWVRRGAAKDPPRGAAHADGPRTSMEVVSRLAGGTTFKEPSIGRSTRGLTLTNEDIAAAIGYVCNPLVQRLALALSTQSTLEWPEIQKLAYPILVQQLQASHNTRAIVAGHRKYRVKLVLHDVFFDMALLRYQRVPRESARRLRMTARDYNALYKKIAGFIETQAQEGAYEACKQHLW